MNALCLHFKRRRWGWGGGRFYLSYNCRQLDFTVQQTGQEPFLSSPLHEDETILLIFETLTNSQFFGGFSSSSPSPPLYLQAERISLLAWKSWCMMSPPPIPLHHHHITIGYTNSLLVFLSSTPGDPPLPPPPCRLSCPVSSESLNLLMAYTKFHKL